MKLIRQSIDSDRVHGSWSGALAFLLALAPALCQAQAPPAYTISTVAGTCDTAIVSPCQGNYGGDGGQALTAFLFGPSDVIFDSSGLLYISDTVNNRIRQVNLSTGIISLFAGNGTQGYAGDGTAVTLIAGGAVELFGPTGIAFDGSGNLYIADYFNYVIREVNTKGIITTVAGDNSLPAGFAGDLGPATAAKLSRPSGVAVDSAGNMYIADPDNNVVRVVCQTQTPIACQGVAAGDINTFAGNELTGYGYTGDGGPPTKALLNNPVAVLLDPAGNLYISDSGNSVIRKVTPGLNGIITTVAGNGSCLTEGMGQGCNFGYSGDGAAATSADLSDPKGLAIDSAGNLYIADHDNSVIRMVDAQKGNIYTIAGNHTFGFTGDGGSATSAQLNFPSGVAAYGGQIYIADNQNNVIRVLTPPAAVPQINAGGVVNGASYTAPVVPGSIASVFGSFFLTSTSIDTTLPLETNLQNLSFEFGGTSGFGSVGAAPLYSVSSTQANLQVPWEAGGQTGVTLAATLNGTTGASQTVNVAAYGPAIFTINESGTGPGAIQDSSYHLVDASNPAIAGTTTILIYCTGLGPVSANQPATGAAASTTELAPTTELATVTIGGITASAANTWSGLAPGFVGLYQVNALVPAEVAAGSAVPVTISIGGVTSNTVTVAVQ
jgi:uncharacterized protein (TIGR03437 family)